MKNHRGAAMANVRSATWRVFGSERLPPLRSNALLADVITWKQAQKTIACFDALFEKNDDDRYWIVVIARTAFNEAMVPTLSHAHCAFALAVCDILLNPASKGIICTEKRMKCRMEHYIVSLR
jgi:hypothetical protein